MGVKVNKLGRTFFLPLYFFPTALTYSVPGAKLGTGSGRGLNFLPCHCNPHSAVSEVKTEAMGSFPMVD
jgi:hypothetical protein